MALLRQAWQAAQARVCGMKRGRGGVARGSMPLAAKRSGAARGKCHARLR